MFDVILCSVYAYVHSLITLKNPEIAKKICKISKVNLNELFWRRLLKIRRFKRLDSMKRNIIIKINAKHL